MHSAEHVVIWDAAVIVLAKVLGPRKLSVISLPAENTAAKATIKLVLAKGKALLHVVPATCARTRVAGLLC
jgi:hypothetical protein